MEREEAKEETLEDILNTLDPETREVVSSALKDCVGWAISGNAKIAAKKMLDVMYVIPQKDMEKFPKIVDKFLEFATFHSPGGFLRYFMGILDSMLERESEKFSGYANPRGVPEAADEIKRIKHEKYFWGRPPVTKEEIEEKFKKLLRF